MSAKPSRSELLAALERGDAAALDQPSELVERARGLLESNDPAAAEGLPEPLLALVAYHAAEHGRAEFMARAIEGPKRLARLAKKELYRLKSEGRPLELPRVAQASVAPQPSSEEHLPILITPVDIDGRRGFVCAHSAPAEGLEAFMGELTDVEGLVRVDAAHMPRREYRKLTRELLHPKEGQAPWMELSAAQLGGLIAQARRRNEARGEHPEGLSLLSRLFPGEPRPHESAGWPPLAPGEEETLVRSSSKLLAEVEFFRWMPTNAALAMLTQRIDEVATSRIIVDESQRRAQIEAALDRTVDEFFAVEERERYAERLFAQADYFEATRRGEVARLAAATARAFKTDRAASTIPFARALFQKALLEQTEAALARLPRHARERLAQQEVQPEADAPAHPNETTTPSGLILPGR